MSNVIPPIPYKSPMLNQQGFLNEAWSKWFRQMFNGVVGANTLPTAADLTSISSSITTLTATVSALQTSVTALQININDLDQGRDL